MSSLLIDLIALNLPVKSSSFVPVGSQSLLVKRGGFSHFKSRRSLLRREPEMRKAHLRSRKKALG